jgi:Nuclease-related domain
VSAAGGSAAARAAALRAGARRGLWRRICAWLGIGPAVRRADAQAAAWDAGAIGEAHTAALLSALEREGAVVLHDRAIPGAGKANADHVVISPGARVFVVDSKLWSASGSVREVDGKLMHGQRNADKDIRNVRFEADLVGRVLGVPVMPLIAVHNAPVAGQGFILRDVPVVPAGRLVELLRANDWPRVAGVARELARRADQVLPPYVQRGR